MGRPWRAWIIGLALVGCGTDDDVDLDTAGLAECSATQAATAATGDGSAGASGASTGDATSTGDDPSATDGGGDDTTPGTTGAPDTTSSTSWGTGPVTGDGGDPTSGTGDTEGTSTTGDTGDTGDTEGTEGTSTTGDTGDTEGTGTTTGEPAVGFADAIWPIFDDRCGCHTDSNGAGKLKLAEGVAYDNLVGQPSNQVPEMLLVDPGASATSYLWHKLVDTHKSVGGKGKVMPPGKELDMEALDLVKAWIDQGAAP